MLGSVPVGRDRKGTMRSQRKWNESCGRSEKWQTPIVQLRNVGGHSQGEGAVALNI